MAVVKMKKFAAIGLSQVKEELMTQLMDLGSAELNSQDARISDERWASLVSQDRRSAELSELEGNLNMVSTVIKTLDAYSKTKSPLFASKRAITESDLLAYQEDREAVWSGIDTVLDLSLRLKNIKSAENRIQTEMIGLKPWAGCGIPLGVTETGLTAIVFGMISSLADTSLLANTIAKNTDYFEIVPVSADEEFQYLTLIFLKEAEEAVSEVLKHFGFSRIYFKEMAGTAAEKIVGLEEELEELGKSAAEIESELENLAAGKEHAELYFDQLTIEKDRLEAFDRLLVTDRSFYIDGWIPASESEKLSAILSSHGCFYELADPADDEEPPVLLQNSKFITPVEVITGLYALPNYREPDPTPIYALFYICFFGIMFADMGYGLILTIAAFAITRARKLEDGTHNFISQLGYCGVSTFVWGLVFGSFFGNLIPVFSETFLSNTFIVKPLWFDPVDNVYTMLAVSCVFGIIHLFVGMGVKAYILIRKRRILEAINDAFMWYILIIGLGLLLIGQILPDFILFAGAGDLGLYMAVIGAAGIVILPVFYAKGIGKALGLWKLYGIVNFLADVLSYTRLLALCLAGTIVAQVFNILAGMNANGFAGVIMFFIILVIAHIFNFLLNGLGCFVHAIRLQYVEFFGKFYEGSGVPFKPFMKNTKYVKVVKEGN